MSITKFTTRTEIKSLRMSNECAKSEWEWSRMLKVSSSMCLGVPFIAPRQLGAIESIPGRQFLPSVDWRTGQSGAPFRPLAWPRVTRGLCGWPLAWPTVGSPDSLVNFSRTPPTKSREWPFYQSQPGAPDTVRCTTGQSGAPRLSRVLAARAKSFPIVFSLILALRQIC
jgi:hypothetical protein